MYRLDKITVLYKILKSEKNRWNCGKSVSTIVSYLGEVFSEELCLPQANLELKKDNSVYAESKSNVMFQEKIIWLDCLK